MDKQENTLNDPADARRDAPTSPSPLLDKIERAAANLKDVVEEAGSYDIVRELERATGDELARWREAADSIEYSRFELDVEDRERELNILAPQDVVSRFEMLANHLAVGLRQCRDLLLRHVAESPLEREWWTHRSRIDFIIPKTLREDVINALHEICKLHEALEERAMRDESSYDAEQQRAREARAANERAKAERRAAREAKQKAHELKAAPTETRSE